MKDYSNYHNANPNDKIENDGNLLFEFSLSGYEAYDITVNGKSSRAIMTPKFNSVDETTQNIYGRIEDIQYGNVISVTETGEEWLVMTKPIDNKIYRKATVRYCNSTFPLPGTKTKTQTGTNAYGDPIYEYTTTPPTLLPCITETTVTFDNSDEAINLPEGQLQVTISYTEHPELVESKEFTMYGSQYQIIGIDHTKSINGVGLLVIKGKKV